MLRLLIFIFPFLLRIASRTSAFVTTCTSPRRASAASRTVKTGNAGRFSTATVEFVVLTDTLFPMATAGETTLTSGVLSAELRPVQITR